MTSAPAVPPRTRPAVLVVATLALFLVWSHTFLAFEVLLAPARGDAPLAWLDLVGNTAGRNGGGAHLTDISNCCLGTSTVTGNEATGGAGGGIAGRCPLLAAAASAGVSTGGRSLIARVSLDSQVGRSGRLTRGAKISASSLVPRVSFSRRSRTSLSRMSRLSLMTCQASS